MHHINQFYLFYFKKFSKIVCTSGLDILWALAWISTFHLSSSNQPRLSAIRWLLSQLSHLNNLKWIPYHNYSFVVSILSECSCHSMSTRFTSKGKSINWPSYFSTFHFLYFEVSSSLVLMSNYGTRCLNLIGVIFRFDYFTKSKRLIVS